MTALPDDDNCPVSGTANGAKTRSPEPSSSGPLRVTIPGALVDKLVALGVPKRSREVASAVTEIANFGIDQASAYLPALADAVALDKALVDRTEELTRVNLELLKALAEFSLVVDGRHQLRALDDLINPE